MQANVLSRVSPSSSTVRQGPIPSPQYSPSAPRYLREGYGTPPQASGSSIRHDSASSDSPLRTAPRQGHCSAPGAASSRVGTWHGTTYGCHQSVPPVGTVGWQGPWVRDSATQVLSCSLLKPDSTRPHCGAVGDGVCSVSRHAHKAMPPPPSSPPQRTAEAGQRTGPEVPSSRQGTFSSLVYHEDHEMGPKRGQLIKVMTQTVRMSGVREHEKPQLPSHRKDVEAPNSPK